MHTAAKRVMLAYVIVIWLNKRKHFVLLYKLTIQIMNMLICATIQRLN